MKRVDQPTPYDPPAALNGRPTPPSMPARPSVPMRDSSRSKRDSSRSSRESKRSNRASSSGTGAGLGLVLLTTAGSGLTAWLIGSAFQSVAGDKMAPWLIGRASGVSCYLLLVALVAVGLGLSHPWRARFQRPTSATRIRIHVSLAVFTLALLVLHVVVLATDEYAKVGWAGAFLPMASEFRPVPITLGVIAAYAGLLSGLTAAMAGRWAHRIWWPIHKVALVTLVLVWLHAVFAGVDTKVLLPLYLITGLAILALAASRYLSSPPQGAGAMAQHGGQGRGLR
jgi:hypothetical protein